MKNKIQLQLEENLRAAAREFQPKPSQGFEQRLTSALAQARVETAARAEGESTSKVYSWKWTLTLASATSLLAVALAWGVTQYDSLATPPAETANRTTISSHDSISDKEKSLHQEFAALVGFFENNVKLPEFAAVPPEAVVNPQPQWPLAEPKWEELLQNPAVRLACSGESLAAAFVLFKDLKNTETK